MTQKDVAEAFVGEGCQSLGAFAVGEVAVAVAYAVLELHGVGPVLEHIWVVVGLKGHSVRLTA